MRETVEIGLRAAMMRAHPAARTSARPALSAPRRYARPELGPDRGSARDPCTLSEVCLCGSSAQ
jgi:hypothetical protein